MKGFVTPLHTVKTHCCSGRFLRRSLEKVPSAADCGLVLGCHWPQRGGELKERRKVVPVIPALSGDRLQCSRSHLPGLSLDLGTS
jgi:hypothetical protein